jgi:hypothetical protein
MVSGWRLVVSGPDRMRTIFILDGAPCSSRLPQKWGPYIPLFWGGLAPYRVGSEFRRYNRRAGQRPLSIRYANRPDPNLVAGVAVGFWIESQLGDRAAIFGRLGQVDVVGVILAVGNGLKG